MVLDIIKKHNTDGVQGGEDDEYTIDVDLLKTPCLRELQVRSDCSCDVHCVFSFVLLLW
jgi:hypothetical protein